MLIPCPVCREMIHDSGKHEGIHAATGSTEHTPAPSPAAAPDTLQHITAGSITGARMTDTPRHSSATGYGSKIPTGYMLEAGGKWRRVYVINYGNAGSTYVLISGTRHYLSPGVELILETVRDGGTLEGARELMAAWPVWMKESEGLPAYAADSPARLEQLRAALDAENISTGELIELQGLAAHIQPGDVQLLEAAGVPEFPEDDDAPALEPGDTFTTPDGRGLLVQFVTPTDAGLKLDGRWISEDGSIEALATYHLERHGYTPEGGAK